MLTLCIAQRLFLFHGLKRHSVFGVLPSKNHPATYPAFFRYNLLLPDRSTLQFSAVCRMTGSDLSGNAPSVPFPFLPICFSGSQTASLDPVSQLSRKTLRRFGLTPSFLRLQNFSSVRSKKLPFFCPIHPFRLESSVVCSFIISYFLRLSIPFLKIFKIFCCYASVFTKYCYIATSCIPQKKLRQMLLHFQKVFALKFSR